MRAGQADCQITVAAQLEDSLYILIVSDNGVGLPEGLDWTNTQSLGMQLLVLLGQRQLNASVELDRSAGTAFH